MLMTDQPIFSSIGRATDDIEVRLSYRIVELFSEGLYTSPSKAVEELVANSFDAGAQRRFTSSCRQTFTIRKRPSS